MGFMDKMKNLVNPTDVDDNYDDEYVFDGSDNENYDYANDYDQPTQPNNNINQNAGQRGGQQANSANNDNMEISGSSLQLKIIRPEKWESVNQIADHLINRRTVVVNFENTNKETARRMIDFLLGVIYTIEGNIEKVAVNIWILTPSNVDLSQEQQHLRQAQASGMKDLYDTI